MLRGSGPPGGPLPITAQPWGDYMSDITLDTDGDILVTGSDLTLTTGADAIKQHLSQRLKTFYGEWFLNAEQGVPYLQQVLKKNPDMTVLDSIFKREILNTPGILQLTEFSLDT